MAKPARSDSMDILRDLFEKHFHFPVERVQPVQGELGGSGRKIIRLSGKAASAIGILYGVREENVAFLEFSRHFRKHGLPVPQIYGQDLDQGAYLEEDLGDTSLFELLSRNRKGEAITAPVLEAYRKAIRCLPPTPSPASHSRGKSVPYVSGGKCYLCLRPLMFHLHFAILSRATVISWWRFGEADALGRLHGYTQGPFRKAFSFSSRKSAARPGRTGRVGTQDHPAERERC